MRGVKSKLKFVHTKGGEETFKMHIQGIHFKLKCANRGVEKIISSPPLHIFKWNSPKRKEYNLFGFKHSRLILNAVSDLFMYGVFLVVFSQDGTHGTSPLWLICNVYINVKIVNKT